MLSKILKREWVTIMNNVFDISLNVLVDCVNEKKDFSLLIKEYTKNVKDGKFLLLYGAGNLKFVWNR